MDNRQAALLAATQVSAAGWERRANEFYRWLQRKEEEEVADALRVVFNERPQEPQGRG